MVSFASKRFCNFPFSSESNQIKILIKFSFRFLAVLTKEFSFQKVFLFEHLCSFFINGYVTTGSSTILPRRFYVCFHTSIHSNETLHSSFQYKYIVTNRLIIQIWLKWYWDPWHRRNVFFYSQTYWKYLFHLSTLETQRSRNDTFSNDASLKSVFDMLRLLSTFSVKEDKLKSMNICGFVNEYAVV